MDTHFIQNHIGQKGRKWTPLRGTLHGNTHEPPFHNSRFQISTDQLQDPLIRDPCGKPTHEAIMVDTVEGNRDTLPISKAFRNRSPLFAMVIPLKAALCRS